MKPWLPPYTYAFSCEPISVAPWVTLRLTPKLPTGQYVPPLVRIVAVVMRVGGMRPSVAIRPRRLVCHSIETSTAVLDSSRHRLPCLIQPVAWNVLWSELCFVVTNEGDASDVATISIYARHARSNHR
jgi:hypothetical protein